MGTTCCCGKINCDQESVFFDVDRYINSEMKSFVEVTAKVYRSLFHWRPDKREPEELIKEETFSFQDEIGRFYNLKGEDTYAIDSRNFGRYQYRIEYTTKRKVALRFEIDDVYDWGKSNSFGHKFIDSIHFRTEAFIDDKSIPDQVFEFGEIIKSCSEDIADNIYYDDMNFNNIRPASFLPSSFEERSEDLETDGIQAHIYKLGENESMPDSVEEFDAKFGEGFNYETKVIDKVFRGAEVSESVEDPDTERAEPSRDVSAPANEGIAKIEYRNQDVNLRGDYEDQFEGSAYRALKQFPFSTYRGSQFGFFNGIPQPTKSYGKDVEIPYDKITSNGSYVLLIDCPNVGTGDFICNKALIELRRISGADLYNAPQFFKDTKTTFVPNDPNNPFGGGEYKTEKIEEQITGVICKPKVRSIAQEPTGRDKVIIFPGQSNTRKFALTAEYIPFDLETTPRFEDTACNEILLPNFILDPSNLEEWRSLYTRTEDGEYVSKDTFMDARFDFNSFLTGPNYFASGGKIELELFKPKTSNLKSGVAETYLQVLYELSYDRELELVGDYSSLPGQGGDFTTVGAIKKMQKQNRSFQQPTGRATAGDFGDTVNLEVVDPARVPLRLKEKNDNGFITFPREFNAGIYDTIQISNSKTKLLTTPKNFSFGSKRSHWTHTFSPDESKHYLGKNRQAKYIYRLKYRVIEGSSTFMGEDYILREFLAASPNGITDRSLASLRNNILSFGQFRNGSHLCFADHSCWITDITDDNCIRTNYPVFRIFDREDELFGPEGNVQFYPKKFISPAAALPQTPGGISVAADIKYKPPILPIDRFGAISPGVSPSRSNYLASLYIRGCAIESGTALVDVSSDLEMYSPNEVHAYNSVPHYGKFSAAKFRFKLRQQEFYPLKLAREDINDKCPKECLAMEHSFEWKLLESDWDVGDRSELSRADYGCTTVLHHQREVVEWGGSFTLERSHDVVLATYIPEPEIVYAACYAAAPRYPAVDDAYFDPFLEEGELPFDLAFICSYDKSGNLKSGPVGLATDYAGTGPTSHVTFVGPQSVTFPYDHDGSRQIVTVESKNLVDGYNGKFSMQTRKKTNNPNTPEEPSESTTTFFGMGSETNHVDAGAIIFENHNKVFDIIDTQAVEIENKYGENHQITLSEVSWAEAGDVFGENVQKNNTYPYSFHIENHKDFIVGTTINGIDLGYGRKTSQISNPIFTEITSGESEYVMRIQGEDEFYFDYNTGNTSKDGRLGIQVTNFYNAGAGLRFRANASNLDLPSFLEEDDCSGEFENDMLFYRRYNDENVSPDRSTSLGNSRFDMSQAQWAIKNENYATLLYQQYIPIVQMLLNKTKLNHPYVEQIVSLIKDTDVDKYWYKIGVDVTVPLDPEEEGYSFTSVVAPKDATVSKIYNKDNFIGRLVNAGDNLFEIITGVEEVKWDFFAGSITEIKVKNGDVVEAGDVVMIGEVGGTTREVVSEVGGRITIDIAIGEELSKNQKLATVDIIEDVVSPVKGQTEQLYVSEGDEVEAGQVLAGVISTVTYEKDSYFYINQEGKNIGPFESAQGFTFKKSTGEYEVRDGVMLFLDGSLQSSTYLSDRIESASPGDPFFWYRETGDGYEIDGESFAESSFGYGQNWLPLVQTTDFGNPVLSSQTTSPVESFFSDAIIPRFTEFSSTINPMLGLGMDDPLGSNIVDISILENDGSYHTQPFTYITRLFEQDFESVVDNNPLFDNDTNEFLLIPAATQKTCDLCSTFDAFGNPVGLPECNSHHPHGYSGPPIPEFFNKIKIPEGETETFNILSTSTTNDSDRFSGEYFLDETARGSCGSLTTFFGLKTETDNSTPRLYYRKIIKKSKVNKCEKLPRLFFDYCNLISGWYLANNEASPVAHITTSLEYKPFRFGLNSRDVVRGNGIEGWTNRHDSLFLSDKDISDIGSMLDRIPKNNNTHNSFLNLVNASYLSWPAGLDENRPQLMGEPGNENVVAAYDEKIPDWRQTYASSFHADKHGGIFLKDYNQILGDVTRFFQERFQTSVLNYDSATGQLTQPLSNILYEHLNGINGNAGYTLRTVTNFVDAKSDGVCGIYKQGPQIPPGGAFVPERSVRSQNCLSVLQASLGMDIYTTSNNVFIGPMLPKIGPFDFTEQENDKELGYKTGSGDFFTQQFPETPGFMPSDDFLKIDKNKVPETGRREKFSDRVLGYEPRGFQGGILDPPPAGTVRSVELGFTKKVKTVPLSEYFFIIGDTTDRYEDI